MGYYKMTTKSSAKASDLHAGYFFPTPRNGILKLCKHQILDFSLGKSGV
jgi:hypothetical protein